ncbi:Golgin subfamily A member 7/ERF4 family-domain-containing protein [Paraphoma chrysanthemicola]|nr:Golgin subfamily A member 7/ERF4 family-domain-containing protein [Paraphoma chrysanthemicola]
MKTLRLQARVTDDLQARIMLEGPGELVLAFHHRALHLHLLLTANISRLSITAPSRTPSAASAPPPPSPLPARWSLTNRVFNLNPLRSFYQGPPRQPASRLWNPVNSSPRTLAVQQPPRQPEQQQQPRDDFPNLPVEQAAAGERDEYPLLTLPQRRQSRQSSLAVERSTGEDSITGRTSIGLPRDRRSLPPTSQPPTPGPAMAPAEDTAREHAPVVAPQGDLEAGVAHNKEHGPTRVSLPGSRRTSMHSGRSAPGDGDEQSEFPWGPSHPCFPHPNPHVPLTSDLYDSTRIIRIKRDWMMKGDLAPTFANLYPEILDPLVSEDDFRILIKKINDTLIDAFDPFTFRAWLDAVLGVATFWLWEDAGFTGVKKKLKDLENWIDDWNHNVGAKEAVKIIPLRRTGYLTLDIQIPDPHLGPDSGSRPQTQEDERVEAIQQQRDQYLPYPLTPTLQVNSQPQPIESQS